MASASSSDDGVPASAAGGFVDPLSGLAADEAPRELQQMPKGTRSYHEHDMRKEVYVPVQRLHELPQWPAPAAEAGDHAAPAVSYVHDFQHPQWRTGFEAGRAPNPRVHTRATAFAAPYLCTGCKQEKEVCTCVSCRVCLGSIGKGSRHHCRKCWNAVCGPCRKRQRHLNAMSWVKTQQLLCDTCAVPQGLAHLTEDPVFAGITLLKEAMDAPNQCVAPLKCGTYTYRRSCPSCSLPTVPTRPHVERLVRIDYCCSMGRKCQKCASAEQRMKAQERETEQLRYRRFDELTPDAVEAIWARTLHIPASGDGLAGAFRWASDTKVRDLLLCLLSASACYEYAGFPHTALELSDVAAARQLLRLRECRQDFSVFEAPGNVAIVAFPGTHDIRTAITDVKFSRVTERTFGHINNGLMRSGPSQPYRQMHGGVQQLWHYRLHEGFNEEERKLRMSLNTATLRNMIAEGKRIVFTGHSLGGALATLVTLRALEDDLAVFQGKVSCITFGAPLVGNSALSTKVRRCGWTPCFTHVIAGSDVVPRLLTERDIHRHAVIALKAAVSSRVDAVRSLFGGSTPSKTEAAATAAELELTMSSAQPSAPVLTEEDTVRAKGESDKDAIDLGFSASGVTSVLEKRAFDCFGEYHMLQRNVRYKATTNHLAAYNALRDGDGVRLDIGDHLLDSYNKAVALQIRSHVEGAEAGAVSAAALLS